jgi:iron complex transport system ATP-binding protein
MKITIDDLSFSYDSSPLLDGIDLVIHKGEILALVGANGSGKTTLLKNISGILTPQKGAVYLDMERLRDLSNQQLARQLGALEQEKEVGFDFTVREIVSLGRIPHRGRFARQTETDRKWIDRAMELTQTADLSDRSMYELSGGERQLVFLAMVLAQNPRVMLLDEPTTYLDIDHQLQIMDIIRQQAAAGLTVVMAIHDLNLSSQYADRVAMLHNGKLLAVGSPQDVLTRENIKKAFNANVAIGKDPVTNSIYVSRIPKRKEVSESTSRLHIICGGGSGVAVLHGLADLYWLSVGVISPLDSDFEAAQQLGATLVTEAPFAPISKRAYEANLAMMRQSDAVVICNTPFGSGNLANLEAALELNDKSKTYILDPEGTEKRDFTSGKATKLVNELIESGGVPVKNLEQLKALLLSRVPSA